MLFSILVGIVAGLLYPQYFIGSRIVFFISFGIAAAVWLALLLLNFTRRDGHDEYGCRVRCYQRFTALVDFALLGVSVAGIAVADGYTVLNSVLFGLDVGLLSLLLLSTYALPANGRRCEE